MTRSQVSELLQVTTRTVTRYRALPDWPEQETKQSILEWATTYGMWDEVAEKRTKNRRRRYGEFCSQQLHLWVPENIYVNPVGKRTCRGCNSNAQRRRYKAG